MFFFLQFFNGFQSVSSVLLISFVYSYVVSWCFNFEERGCWGGWSHGCKGINWRSVVFWLILVLLHWIIF